MTDSIIATKAIEILKGGAGSGSWESPGNPRFAYRGKSNWTKATDLKEGAERFIKEFNAVKTFSFGGVDEKQRLNFLNALGEKMSAVKQEFPDAFKKPYSLMFEDRITSSSGDSKTLAGNYNAGSSTISVATKIGKSGVVPIDSLVETATHELGHHFNMTCMSMKKQGQFEEIFHSLDRSVISTKVSQYGTTNYLECFAESFAKYLNPKFSREKMPEEIMNFLEKQKAKGGKRNAV